MKLKMNNLERIQYISDGFDYNDQIENVKNALDNGIQWVQLRWKTYPATNELHNLAYNIKKLCQEYKATYIINDHVSLAKEMDADGIHLGLNDESIDSAKNILGESKIFGGTANTYEDVIRRQREGCDYIGLGPMRFTPTKKKLSPILGLEGYKNICNKIKAGKIVTPPIFAIGGLEENDIQKLIHIGIYGIAVSSLIKRNPELITKLKTNYEEQINNCR
ncbi:thiamine phosphate synthase [Sphingobacterium daejeonense]|uniref:thiamine phosphate synthase n=1 Tax=Sphingobacterium daejeonense TaxID=371142 RepID=UPI0010C37005|nr:thiamine phosphate synthase [Sphingobacterium daejeonense]VTP95440.1 Thiamine-phosphate synthase [Sphingobacterium daejeonense]